MTKKVFIFIFFALSFFSCSNSKSASKKQLQETFTQLMDRLSRPGLSEESRYAIINNVAKNLYASNEYDKMNIFLTDWVENHPDDSYNAYWLYMVASAYLAKGVEPVAEYYYERILKNYQDLLIKDQSIHFSCLQRLIQISGSTVNRISYFTMLIKRFPKNVNITEMYVRLALEYEKEGEWKQALTNYFLFLDQPDSSTIQIAGIPDAYVSARKMVDFDNSPKNWTFESLESLEKAVKDAIVAYDWKALDKYRSKVNFFTMSWKTSAGDTNAQKEFSMRNFMRGNKIRFNAVLDDASNPNEAYLRTTGWNSYVNVWFLYFRKVNFPADPDLHGRWEWAGIYLGERL